jgi:hypothetical protein
VIDSQAWGDSGKAKWHLDGCAVSVQADDAAVAAQVASEAASGCDTPTAEAAAGQLRPPPARRTVQFVALREFETLREAASAEQASVQVKMDRPLDC